MQFLTIVKPGPMPPPPELMRSAQDWVRDKLGDGTFECCYSFVDGGGFAVGSADSLEQLQQDLLDYPLSPFVDYEVRPLVGIDDAFERFQAAAERMSAQFAAAQQG
jgi:hypothetical protein